MPVTPGAPTAALLDRFLVGLRALAPVAVWAHGSLAGGDYQEGVSDLDLIVVLEETVSLAVVRRVIGVHRALRATGPLACKLHCTYLTPHTAAGADRAHLTWAHDHVMRRPVTPVTRRELHAFGRVLHGAAPGGLLPPVPDRELADFVVRDQAEFWRPAVRKAQLWTRDIWVDLGLVTHARARVTIEDGRLISKREALDLLPGFGAPVEVVADIRRRRYRDGDPAAPALDVVRRGELARGYLGPAIDGFVAAHGAVTRS
ncbi:DNA polymerase beta domain protein region [Actinobacteria bacterium OK074]|nr:DNA polymerase beta domain protein region [Actinobacteria bacterium OK074]